MQKENINGYDVLIEKLTNLLVNNGFTLYKNFEKNSYNNKKYVEELVGDLPYSEIQKYRILLNDILDEKEKQISNYLFSEFSVIFTKLKEHEMETKYLEKILKNFSEEDYSESIINVGKALESLSKTVLVGEEENDSFNALLHRLIKERKITREEQIILEKIRDCRNDNAHGNEIFVEIPKESAENCILTAFDMMENILSRI